MTQALLYSLIEVRIESPEDDLKSCLGVRPIEDDYKGPFMALAGFMRRKEDFL